MNDEERLEVYIPKQQTRLHS